MEESAVVFRGPPGSVPRLHKFVAFDLEFDSNLPETWGLETTEEERTENASKVRITCAGVCGWNGEKWYEKQYTPSKAGSPMDERDV